LCIPQVPPEQHDLPTDGHVSADEHFEKGEFPIALKAERIFSAFLPQSGQSAFLSATLDSFSKIFPQALHLNSNMGMSRSPV
jgi:hypothetical protein